MIIQEELLPLIYNKDQKSFTLLYDHYAKSLYSIILSIVKIPEDAEKALSDTFETIWSSLESYDTNKERFFTWVIKIGKKSAVNVLREKGINIDDLSLSSEHFTNLTESQPAQGYTVETLPILQFIKQLKPKQIKIIDFLLFKTYSLSDTAEQLDSNPLDVQLENQRCINLLTRLFHIE